MIKILYGMTALFCTLCGAQMDQQAEDSVFNYSLNTFINGFDHHEGVVNNTLLVDFRRDDATEYLENICDRLNQMALADIEKTGKVLSDISFKIIHARKSNLFESQPNQKLCNDAILHFLNFLPLFKDIQLIDSTQRNHIGFIIFMNNVTYFNEILGKKGVAFSYESHDDLNNSKAFIWENIRDNDPLFELL
ncbi:MAG: hypothetical protein CNLJKLNK_01244 [Holosporales bacterium]